ncbi:MAG: class I SAM-dependent methyltransferase, partial [Nitrospinota bacterium]
MKLKYDIKYPLDSPLRTIHHREIIKKKRFLRKLYEQWYDEFIAEAKKNPHETFIELGAGGGFLKELLPDVICTDILDLASNDITFSALEMPFKQDSVRGIFMVDTL